jgi:ABC-type multidrug transport system ATPase subunit
VPLRANPSSGGTRAHLLIRTMAGLERDIPLKRQVLTVGRASDNDIVLPQPYVSSHHGRFTFQRGVWHYRDLDSTNGTYINGRRSAGGPLQDGDVLRIGHPAGESLSLTFSTWEAYSPEDGGPMGSKRMGVVTVPRSGVLTIGRSADADIPLEAPVVSRQHAQLEHTPQGAILTDLNSTNGTFVNGERLTRPRRLRENDMVQIGPFTLVYTDERLQQYSATAGVRLDAVRLVREVGPSGRRKRILNDISLSIAPREFVAVVGTSGAGKSTLVMALNGFSRADGHVLVNGDDLYTHFDLYRTMVGYVPQDDIVHQDLSVIDGLRYAARLRLPPDTSSDEIERRIDEVLELVEMVGQREQLVSSLSGGQRKRVSIAAELLAEPNLFFLDEPTSGLDPGLEKKMMVTMRRLADGGRTVVLVTHATANIVQCDHVCFLSQGRLVYFGPPQKVFEFFGVETGDFADVYALLDDPDPQVARKKAAEWEKRFRESQYCQAYVAKRLRRLREVQEEAASSPARQRPKVNPLRQLLVLSRRYLNLVMRDKLLLAVLMGVMPIIGALVLLISEPYWLVGSAPAEIERQLAEGLGGGQGAGQTATYNVVHDTQRLLHILSLASILLGLFGSVYEIVKEWSVYQRERMVSLRIVPYLGSKLLVLGGFALIQCFLLLLVVSFRVSLPSEGVLLPAPLEMYVTLVLGALAAITLGLLISAVVPNTNAVIYLVFLVLFFQMIFSGVMFDLPTFAGRFSVFTFTRWCIESLGATVDVEELDQLTRVRFMPDPVTETVSMDVERPDDDWEPVTVMTVTEEIEVPVGPGVTQTVPISVPQVTMNEMVSVTETITDTVTVEPGVTDVYLEQDFKVSYARTPAHLLFSWSLLAAFGLILGGATAAALRSKDVG